MAWYPRWRAAVIMLVVQCWMVGILAAWIRVLKGIDFFSLPRWWFFLVASILVLVNGVFAEKHFDSYKKRFDSWPDDKRARWDLLVTIFVVCIFVFTMYSAVAARQALGL